MIKAFVERAWKMWNLEIEKSRAICSPNFEANCVAGTAKDKRTSAGGILKFKSFIETLKKHVCFEAFV